MENMPKTKQERFNKKREKVMRDNRDDSFPRQDHLTSATSLYIEKKEIEVRCEVPSLCVF